MNDLDAPDAGRVPAALDPAGPPPVPWRGWARVSMALHLVAVVLLGVGLLLDSVLTAEGFGLSVRVGYFSAEVCGFGVCSRERSVDQLTCGGAAGVTAGAAFHILSLAGAACVAILHGWHESCGREPIAHATVAAQAATCVCGIAGSVALGIVRAQATYSPAHCPDGISGLERYAVGSSWYVGLIAGGLLATVGLSIFAASHYGRCCAPATPPQRALLRPRVAAFESRTAALEGDPDAPPHVTTLADVAAAADAGAPPATGSDAFDFVLSIDDGDDEPSPER